MTVSEENHESEPTYESGQQDPYIALFVKWDILKILDEGRDLCCCPRDFEPEEFGAVGIVPDSFQNVHQQPHRFDILTAPDPASDPVQRQLHIFDWSLTQRYCCLELYY
jgi:hypothetical protein